MASAPRFPPQICWCLLLGGVMIAGCMTLEVTGDGQTDPDTAPIPASLQGVLAVLPEYDPEAERADSAFAPLIARALDSLRASAGGASVRVVPAKAALLDSLYSRASVYPRAGLTFPLQRRLRAITDAQYVAFIVVPGMTERRVRRRGTVGGGFGPGDLGAGSTPGTAVDGAQVTALGVVWDLSTGAVLWSGSALVDARGGPGQLAPLGENPRRALLPRLARRLANEMIEE